MQWYDDPRVLRVIDEGEVLHVAVLTRAGPRVTPAAFHHEGRQLWFVTERSSAKARAIARENRVGALIRASDEVLMLGGTARLVDPLTARGIPSFDRLFDLPFAAAGYLGRNSRHATGVIRERPVPTLPLSRVAVSLEVERGALLRGENAITEWGTWSHAQLLIHEPPPELSQPDLAALPDRLSGLLVAGAPVALGWESLSGPIALPGRLIGTVAAARVSPAAIELAGARSSCRGCITADRGGPRLGSKQGVMLSGEASACLTDGGALAAIDWRRATVWVGDRVSSHVRS